MTETTMPPEALAAADPVVATVPPPSGSPPVAVAEPFSPREWAATRLHARGVGPSALISFALALSLTAAFLFMVRHPGMGAVLGFVALALSELAAVPAGPQIRDARDLVRGLSPFVDLMMLAGLIGGIAHYGTPAILVTGLLVLVLEAGLPLLRLAAGPHRMMDTTALWTRADRLGLILLGALIGRPGTALLCVAAVGLLDAWLRIERLDMPAGMKPEPQATWLKHILREDGSLEPVVRWGSLALCAVALFILPISNTWRF